MNIKELEDTRGQVFSHQDEEEEVVYIDLFGGHRFAAGHKFETDEVTLYGFIDMNAEDEYPICIKGKNWDNARLIIMDLLADPDFPLDDTETAIAYYKHKIA